MRSIFITLIFLFPIAAFADYESAYKAYSNGDYEQALPEFLQLANEGHLKAQFYLGGMYREGLGVDQDYAESLKWYEKSAEQGEPKAMHNVALFYHNGIAVKRDISTAITWYEKAAVLD
jgi:uncharacterized protein